MPLCARQEHTHINRHDPSQPSAVVHSIAQVQLWLVMGLFECFREQTRQDWGCYLLSSACLVPPTCTFFFQVQLHCIDAKQTSPSSMHVQAILVKIVKLELFFKNALGACLTSSTLMDKCSIVEQSNYSRRIFCLVRLEWAVYIAKCCKKGTFHLQLRD